MRHEILEINQKKNAMQLLVNDLNVEEGPVNFDFYSSFQVHLTLTKLIPPSSPLIEKEISLSRTQRGNNISNTHELSNLTSVLSKYRTVLLTNVNRFHFTDKHRWWHERRRRNLTLDKLIYIRGKRTYSILLHLL